MLSQLAERTKTCVQLPVQYRPVAHKIRVDPITQRELIISPARNQRQSEFDAEHQKRTLTSRVDCQYCRGETTPTLFYVQRSGTELLPIISQENQTIDAARQALRDRPENPGIEFFRDTLVKQVARAGNLPTEPWLSRAFLNITPSLIDPQSEANCFVIGIHPSHHYSDIPELPMEILEALVLSWQVLEQWCDERELIGIPLVNGGKRAESGQSIYCFHSQFFAISRAQAPSLYQAILRTRLQGGCPVCSILQYDEYTIYENSTVRVLVHPFPERIGTLFVAPSGERADLNSVNTHDLADALTYTIRLFKAWFGQVPAYNISIRSGDLVGHVHAEIVPKTHTNVPASFEAATHQIVIPQDPMDLVHAFKRIVPIRAPYWR